MSYESAHWLAADATFLLKTRMAMVEASIHISAEAPETPYHSQRVAYATACLRLLGTNDSEHHKLAVSIALDPLGASIAAGSADADFYNAVSAVWNAHAGIVSLPVQ